MNIRNESRDYIDTVVRTSRCTALVLVLGSAAACSSNANVSSQAASSEPESTIEAVDELVGTLNYDGLRADNLCQGGGERPCFAPIRTEPHFTAADEAPSSNYLNPGTYTVDENGDRHYTAVTWPYEAGNGEPADVLTVVCRVIGDEVAGHDPSLSSNIWDAVVIPAELASDGIARVGYAPERWMELPAGKIIESCDDTENPAGAPLATAPTT